MADLRHVTYCGLYCGLCSMGGRIPGQAQALRDSLRREGAEGWGQGIPGFPEFWSYLLKLSESAGDCSCRESDCGPPYCGIRKCARERGIDVCAFCDDYPCERVLCIAKGYVTLLADGARMKEIGLDRWIE